MTGVSVQPLTTEAADEAYVLGRLGYETLSLDDWRMAVAGRSSGQVLIAREGDGSPRGLLIWSLCPSLAGAPILHIERLVAFDLMEPLRMAEPLLQAAMEQGRRRGCQSVLFSRSIDEEGSVAQVLASDAAVLHRVF